VIGTLGPVDVKGRGVVRAIVVSETGGPEVLTLGELPDPVAGPGQIVAQVGAVGVNFRDIYERSGVYPVRLPTVPGAEGAGTVVAVGEGVTEFAIGDRVAWNEGRGSYAEKIALPAVSVVPVPADVELKTAAAVMLQGMTAHYLCRSTFPVTDGTVTVVHAAAGGVGLLLTQLIKKFGGTVVATTSTTAKAVLAKQAGADHVAGYAEFGSVVRELTGGRGADVVFDGVGKDTFNASLAALHPRGMMVLFGGSSGQVPPFDLQRLNRGGSLYVTRPTMAHYIADRAELLWRAGDLFEWIATGELDVRVGAEYPLADARRAHEDLAARRTTGKVLLIP
jgi:NADPH2:quinone reductase